MKKTAYSRVLSAVLVLGLVGSFAATATAARKPDLVVTKVSNPPPTKAQGKLFKIKHTAKNNGSKKAPSSKTGFYLSLDNSISESDVRLVGTRFVKGLDPGTRFTGRKQVMIPFNTPVDSYFVLACADDHKELNESQEANNCKASSQQMDVTLKDTAPPAAPTITDTDPVSPNSDASPNVVGTAEPDSSIRIFKNATCAGIPAVTEAASETGDFDIEVTVTENATTELSATATDAGHNASPCSNSVAYTHESAR